MNCRVCGGSLRSSPTGAGSMCAGCDRLFAASGEEVLPPVGVDPLVHSRTLGFPGPAPAAPPMQFIQAADPRPASMAWMRMLSVAVGCGITALIVGIVGVSVAGSILWASLGGRHHH